MALELRPGIYDHPGETNCPDHCLRVTALGSKTALALETPLVQAIFDGRESGILRGHREIRPFFEEGARRRPSALATPDIGGNPWQKQWASRK